MSSIERVGHCRNKRKRFDFASIIVQDRNMKWWYRRLAFALVLQLMVVTPMVEASNSTNYSINEDNIGGSGGPDSASANFKSLNTADGGQTLGDTAVGNSASTNFQTNSGYNTSGAPTLSFSLSTTTVDLGILTRTATNTATAGFSVGNYSSRGYIVQMVGPTPTYNGHPLTALASDTTSSVGTEQYGINTVANTIGGGAPANFGLNPVQMPDASFSAGVAGDGITGTFGTTRPYTINGKYRYVSGETIASSGRSNARTDFTISFIANISATTPGGQYKSNQALICTATF